LDPSDKPLTVEAWMTATKPNGVVIARGGPTHGFALSLKQGKATFSVRANSELVEISGGKRLVGGWHHLVGMLGEDKSMRLYVDGERVADGVAKSLLPSDPAQGLEVGCDADSAVGDYESPNTLAGIVDEPRLYFMVFDDEAVSARYQDGHELSDAAVLAASFDDGSARDHSLHRNNGTVENAKVVEGKFGKALMFTPSKKKAGNQKNQGNSLVKPKWAKDVPIYVRSMALAGTRLFIVGPPDIIDEEQTFQGLSENDPQVQKLLAEQDAVLEGTQGSRLIAVNTLDGSVEEQLNLRSLPAWDGLIAANEKLFLATKDGQLICFDTSEDQAEN
jgi:hypothetical protein